MLEQCIQDTRFAMRRLRKRPMFATLAVMTLALGVGGTAAVYSLVRTLLLSPLPYTDQSSLVAFWNPFDWSQAEHLFLQDSHAGFTDVAAYTRMDLTLTGPEGSTLSVPSVLPSANLFDVLGVKPIIGRGFREGDDRQGAASVMVLSHSLWRELGADPNIIGRQLPLGGEPHTVIGIMPRGFWFPDPRARLWVNSPFLPTSNSGNYAMVGRLEPGRDIATMGEPLQRMTTRLRERFTYPAQWDKSANPVLTPLADDLAGSVKPMLLATLAAMALILLIACSNVAALMLGQVDMRSTEFAVRSALGASRRQLLRQLIIEALVLGSSAGVVGAMLAAASFNLLRHSLPLGALVENAQLSWNIFGAAMVISLGAAAIVAAAPALSLWRGDLRDTLTRSRSSGLGARGGATEGVLVIAEVALAVLIVAGAALLIRTVTNLRSIDAGVDTENVAVVEFITGYMTPREDRVRVFNQLIPALEALPGVERAAITQRLPIRGGGDNWGFEAEGIPGEPRTTAFRIVSPGYFDAMGIRVVAGRGFTEADATNTDPLIVINESTRREFFGNADPIGRRASNGTGGMGTVIGVVEDIAEATLTQKNTTARYQLLQQLPYTPLSQTIVLRMQKGRDATQILDAVRNTIRTTAPSFAVRNVTTMQQVFDEAVGPALQLMSLLVLLGGLALLLGAIGVYGVVSHFVTRRRREWSIRLALGLRPIELIAQIVTRGGTLVTIGAVIGIIAALGMMRVLATFLYEVKPADSTSLLSATATLILAGMLAALIPALRASRVDPAKVLREQ